MSCFSSGMVSLLFLKECEMLMLVLEPEFLLGCLPSRRSVMGFVDHFGFGVREAFGLEVFG